MTSSSSSFKSKGNYADPFVDTRCVSIEDPLGDLDDGEEVVGCGCCSIELNGKRLCVDSTCSVAVSPEAP